jgi:hypothetical protein
LAVESLLDWRRAFLSEVSAVLLVGYVVVTWKPLSQETPFDHHVLFAIAFSLNGDCISSAYLHYYLYPDCIAYQP